MRKMFGPAPVPRKFDEFPKEMALRPSQIRASAAETALMIPDAFVLRKRYADLKIPVVIIAGEEDRLIDIDKQSARLHRDVTHSTLHRVPGAGHISRNNFPSHISPRDSAPFLMSCSSTWVAQSSIRERKSVSLIIASDIVLSLARSLPKQLRTAS